MRRRRMIVAVLCGSVTAAIGVMFWSTSVLGVVQEITAALMLKSAPLGWWLETGHTGSGAARDRFRLSAHSSRRSPASRKSTSYSAVARTMSPNARGVPQLVTDPEKRVTCPRVGPQSNGSILDVAAI